MAKRFRAWLLAQKYAKRVCRKANIDLLLRLRETLEDFISLEINPKFDNSRRMLEQISKTK